MKDYRIKTSFVSPEGPSARPNKTGIDFMILYCNISGKLTVTRYMILLWLKTGSNSEDINGLTPYWKSLLKRCRYNMSTKVLQGPCTYQKNVTVIV